MGNWRGRKEEKKRQKKAVQLGEKHEMSDHRSKHGHKKRKYEGQDIVGPETRKVLKDTVEQLEKSGISEEHEAPSCSQALHGTPESSLDSNKRLRATVSSSPSQTRNGVFRVKLAPSNQRRDPEPTAVFSVKPRVLEQPPVKEMGLDLSMAKRASEFQPHINTLTVAMQLVAPEQNMALRNGNHLGKSRQVNLQQPAMVMQRVNIVPGVSPQPAPKAMQRVDPPPTRMLQRVEPAPANVMQRAGQLMPPKLFQRETPQVPANMLKKVTAAAPLGLPSVEQPALLHKPKISVEPPVVKQQQQMDAPAKEEPCSVGTSTAVAQVKEVQRPRSDRKSRKAEKKERKFGDLFVTWNPSPIQMEDMDVGDQDWLFSCGATPRSSCRAFDGPARSQPTEQLFSLQPRAVHFPDLHMYQLPYAVPF